MLEICSRSMGLIVLPASFRKTLTVLLVDTNHPLLRMTFLMCSPSLTERTA